MFDNLCQPGCPFNLLNLFPNKWNASSGSQARTQLLRCICTFLVKSNYVKQEASHTIILSLLRVFSRKTSLIVLQLTVKIQQHSKGMLKCRTVLTKYRIFEHSCQHSQKHIEDKYLKVYLLVNDHASIINFITFYCGPVEKSIVEKKADKRHYFCITFSIIKY